MSDYTCPICGENYTDGESEEDESFFSQNRRKNPCEAILNTDEDFINMYCHSFDVSFSLHKDIYYMADQDKKEKLLNLLVEHLLHNIHYNANEVCYFYFNNTSDSIDNKYPNYVNLAKHLANYPTQVLDIAHRSLVNYSLKYPHFGDFIYFSFQNRRLSFEHEVNNNRGGGVLNLLLDLGYMKESQRNRCHIITTAGWQKIDELRKEEQIVHQGFIAMSFREETSSIREAFRKAMKESGYSVAVIDEKEHNNQIVPEIFYEIERSKFVVVDVTYPNYGAYYEAGYAQALGKQVIICCRKKEFDDNNNPNRPHFDISQKSMVVWANEEDLVARLKKRIEATVR